MLLCEALDSLGGFVAGGHMTPLRPTARSWPVSVAVLRVNAAGSAVRLIEELGKASDNDVRKHVKEYQAESSQVL